MLRPLVPKASFLDILVHEATDTLSVSGRVHESVKHLSWYREVLVDRTALVFNFEG
ncbi:MAG: hypothetical protein QG597_4660, partial [Actinomycetota bacterium]|nr:hypothetical protein [Actinomycetota bacterium]